MSDDTIPTSKMCTKCLQDLPMASYGKQKLGKYGLRSTCKPCSNALVSAHSKANPEVRRAWQKANREKLNARQAQYRARDPELVRQKGREWYAANSEAIKTRKTNWRKKNVASERARYKQYYQLNRESRLAGGAKYREENPNYWRDHQVANREMYAAAASKRRAKIRGSISPNFTTEGLLARIEYYGHKCWICGDPWEHLDHVKPLARGGCHILANIRPACAFCNRSKGCRWPFTPPLKQEKK